MIVGYGAKHCLVAIEGRDGLWVDEERTVARTLEGKVKLNALIAYESVETVDNLRSRRITDMYSILYAYHTIAVGL